MRLLSILVAVFDSKWPRKQTNRTLKIHLRNNLMVDKEDEAESEDDPECQVEMLQGDKKTNFCHFCQYFCQQEIPTVLLLTET